MRNVHLYSVFCNFPLVTYMFKQKVDLFPRLIARSGVMVDIYSHNTSSFIHGNPTSLPVWAFKGWFIGHKNFFYASQFVTFVWILFCFYVCVQPRPTGPLLSVYANFYKQTDVSNLDTVKIMRDVGKPHQLDDQCQPCSSGTSRPHQLTAYQANPWTFQQLKV